MMISAKTITNHQGHYGTQALTPQLHDIIDRHIESLRRTWPMGIGQGLFKNFFIMTQRLHARFFAKIQFKQVLKGIYGKNITD